MISEHISLLILSFLLICTDSTAMNLTAFLNVVTTLKLWQRHFFPIFFRIFLQKKTERIQDINELKQKIKTRSKSNLFFYFCKFAKKNCASCESKRTSFVINVWESQSQAFLCFLALFAFSCILMFWWMCRITGLSIRLFIFL